MRLLFTILQVALGIFSKNPELSAGNLCGYFPQDTIVTEAPKGYKPFYISHIARHGSRLVTNSERFQVIDTLAYYAGKGMLTQDGLTLLEELRLMHQISEGHYGDLTELGALEHRQICGRMVRHYPGVFSNPKRTLIKAYSTTSPRVIESMDSFLSELSGRVPGLKMETLLANSGKEVSQEVTGYRPNTGQEEEVKRQDKHLREVGHRVLKGRNDFSAFESRVFIEPENVSSSTVSYVARNTFRSFKTGRLTAPANMPSMGKYFTPDELYALWGASSLGWHKYLTIQNYVSPYTTTRGYGILDCIVKDADQAIKAESNTAATLRFSHDVHLLPLMCAIPLEGTVLDCDETQLLERFQDFNFYCPACNVQMIFYRNRCGRILVKFLLNEKETLIHGLAPKTGFCYDWKKVKRFWSERAHGLN